MSRVILLSGIGGAGTSTLAAATLEALRAEGVHAVLVDGSGDTGLDERARDHVTAALGPVFAELGADPVAPEAWSGLAGLAHLGTLLAVAEAAAEAPAVVVDAGDHRTTRALIELPGVLLRLLDAALTPRLAMWRGPGGADIAFDALSQARLTMLDLAQLLARETTTVRLVTLPRADAVERTAAALSVLSTLGVGVEGVIVNRYPRRSEGWPRAVLAAAEEALQAMTRAAGAVPVWKSTSRLRPVPKGRSARGPWGRVQALNADQLTVVVEDEAYLLDLPLSARARAQARVGVLEDRLVVSVDGANRWIDLPPVLRRCTAEVAIRTEAGLRVRFRPDPGLWRQPAQVGTS